MKYLWWFNILKSDIYKHQIWWTYEDDEDGYYDDDNDDDDDDYD